MIKVIVVDDEPLATELILEYLRDFSGFEIVDVCYDGFEALKSIQKNMPDLVFLDVEMPKLNGFELLELMDHPPAIIFTTAYEQFALKAFDHQAVDYLLKPFSKQRFEKALSKIQSNPINPYQSREFEDDGVLHRVVLKDKNDIKIIPVEEVIYLEANDDYVNLYTTQGKFLKNKTMAYFEKVLSSKDFCRVHRSYIVKLDQITKLEVYEKDSYCVKMISGEKIPVSKSGYVKLKIVLGI
jgi:two-component system, LytTR family, response regulator